MTRGRCVALSALGVFVFATGSVRAHAQTLLPQWQLSPQPVLVLDDNGSPLRQFFVVVGTARSQAGYIAVANRGTLEVRVFDGSGSHVDTYGRKGQGPGEFEGMALLGRRSDTLVLYDNALRRVSHLAIHGGQVRSYVLAPKNAHPSGTYPVGALPSGRLLVVPNTSSKMARPHGLTRDTVSFGIFDPVTDSIVWLPPMPRFTSLVVNPTNAPRAMARGVYPFGPQLHHSIVGEAVWFADTHEDQIKVFHSSGRIMTRLPVTLPPQRYDDAAFGRARSLAFARATSEPSRIVLQHRFDPRFRGRLQPRHGPLIPALDGTVWIQKFRMSEAEPANFLITDRAGRPVATASVPRGFVVSEIGTDYVLGTVRDELGAESIVLYGLIRR